MKKIALLGSTGSVGRQTLEVARALKDEVQVVALAAGKNDALLAEQINLFKPSLAVLAEEEALARLKKHSLPQETELASGAEGQILCATHPEADLVVLAQSGFSGFRPLLAALEAGKMVALANKEAIVSGGDLLERLGLFDRQKIIPLDSEHAAIWQAKGGAKTSEIEKVILTASGGPFFGWSKRALEKVTPKEALKHPNWAMGPKITIDSATMMNKGLEVIEACWLFDLKLSQVEVVVHRQSVVHSVVEYIDGTMMAQLGSPDMRAPIQHALTYPARKKGLIKKYSLRGNLSFEEPDYNNFPCLNLARQAFKAGGTMPAVLSAANEVAVEHFLEGKIGFTKIPKVIEMVTREHQPVFKFSLDEVLEADHEARQVARLVIEEEFKPYRAP